MRKDTENLNNRGEKMADFLDKVVVITGAANGIGRETVREFAKEGAKIALVDLKNEELESAARYANLKTGDFILVVADVSCEDQVKNYVDKTMQAFGKIDVCVHNAGIEGELVALTDYPLDVFMRVLSVNLAGIYLGMKYAIPVMARNKTGAIINMSSIMGLRTVPRGCAYIASKFGVNGLTRVAAKEYGNAGIRINSVCPGFIETEMVCRIEKAFDPDHPELAKAAFESLHALNRYGTSLEVVNMILFLASDKASYMTGGNYVVDGGFTA
jgi:NAD(P)-dependent dehydrogenase (short-subunit alcohol dehydrogenase family)